MESVLAGNGWYQDLIGGQIQAPYWQSLAVPQVQVPGRYPSAASRNAQGKGGDQTLQGDVDTDLPGERTFFDPNASHLDNIGALGNLAISGMGLVGMFKNLKAQDLNYDNAKESMAQQTEAYNDRKDSLARSREAVAAANRAYAQ